MACPDPTRCRLPRPTAEALPPEPPRCENLAEPEPARDDGAVPVVWLALILAALLAAMVWGR